MRRFLLVLFFSSFFLPPLAAQTPIDITGWVNWADGSSAETLDDSDLEFNAESGYGFGINAFWSPQLSTELMWSTFEREALLNDDPRVDLGVLKLAPITGLIQYHFAPHSWIDPYVGAGAAYAQFDELESTDLESLGVSRIEIDDQLGYAIGAGARLRLGSRWGGVIDARYLSFDAEGISEGFPLQLEIQPLLWSAGISYRF